MTPELYGSAMERLSKYQQLNATLETLKQAERILADSEYNDQPAQIRIAPPGNTGWTIGGFTMREARQILLPKVHEQIVAVKKQMLDL